MLTKNQFDVLECIESAKQKLTQRNIATSLNLSVGSINKVIADLTMQGFLLNGEITEKGLNALEPYKVKRAVIVAAGLGSRLIPVTLNVPKPLIRVKGKRMIETTLDALLEVGITEIYIVRGYLGKQFDELLTKYPTIKFIDNNIYNEGNNICSVYFAREFLQNSYILEADWVLYNKNIIKKYQYSSNYLGIPEKETNDWCLFVNNKIITKVAIGGKNCYRMVGISYWTEKDGKQLSKDIEKVYNSPGGKERYWDQVPLDYCKDNYKLNIRVCSADDIIEIDTFNELKAIDSSYDV